MTRVTLKSTLLLSALALPMAALAQPATSPTAPSPTAPGPTAPGPAGAGQPGASAETRVESRITELHGALKITPQQEDAWRKFADVMRSNAREMDQAYQSRAQQFTNISAEDNLKSWASLAKEHADHVAALVGPFSALYDTFSPDQKKVADERFRNVGEEREGGQNQGHAQGHGGHQHG